MKNRFLSFTVVLITLYGVYLVFGVWRCASSISQGMDELQQAGK